MTEKAHRKEHAVLARTENGTMAFATTLYSVLPEIGRHLWLNDLLSWCSSCSDVHRAMRSHPDFYIMLLNAARNKMTNTRHLIKNTGSTKLQFLIEPNILSKAKSWNEVSSMLRCKLYDQMCAAARIPKVTMTPYDNDDKPEFGATFLEIVSWTTSEDYVIFRSALTKCSASIHMVFHTLHKMTFQGLLIERKTREVTSDKCQTKIVTLHCNGFPFDAAMQMDFYYMQRSLDQLQDYIKAQQRLKNDLEALKKKELQLRDALHTAINATQLMHVRAMLHEKTSVLFTETETLAEYQLEKLKKSLRSFLRWSSEFEIDARHMELLRPELA